MCKVRAGLLLTVGIIALFGLVSCTTLLREPMQQPFSSMAFGSLEIAEIVEFLEGVVVPTNAPPGVEAKIESVIKKLEKAVDFLDAGKEEEAEELLEAAFVQLNETISQVESLKCSVKKGRCIPDEEADQLIVDLETACSMIENIFQPTFTKMCVANYKNSTISQANLDGTGGTSLGNLNGTLNKPELIAVDTAAGKIYVTNWGNNTVTIANLDGSGAIGKAVDTLDRPYGIALDLAAGKMYVVNADSNMVTKANLDGSGGTALPVATLNHPIGIALNLAAGKMYVTNSVSNTVTMANLDGSGGTVLPVGPLNQPIGIALDVAGGKMYVVNASSNTVTEANLDGTGSTSLPVATLNAPNGIALNLAAQKMYVTNGGNNTVTIANLDGTGGDDLGNLNGTINGPVGIVLY